MLIICFIFFFSSRRRHTRWPRDWSSDVCSSDLLSLVDSVPAGFLDARLIERIHAAPRTAAELTDKWPAHVHIDLLPVVQGQGMGRATMIALLDLLRAAGAPGVHLGVDPANTGAVAFYERLGYQRFTPESSMFVRNL